MCFEATSASYNGPWLSANPMVWDAINEPINSARGKFHLGANSGASEFERLTSVLPLLPPILRKDHSRAAGFGTFRPNAD